VTLVGGPAGKVSSSRWEVVPAGTVAIAMPSRTISYPSTGWSAPLPVKVGVAIGSSLQSQLGTNSILYRCEPKAKGAGSVHSSRTPSSRSVEATSAGAEAGTTCMRSSHSDAVGSESSATASSSRKIQKAETT